MIRALRERVVPRLRELGFQGSFPHFRRPLAERTELLGFQFDKHGGGFVVEIAKAPPGDLVTPGGEVIPAAKLRAYDLPTGERLRLGARKPGGDHWFRYDRGLFRRKRSFEELSEEVLRLLDSQALPWWRGA